MNEILRHLMGQDTLFQGGEVLRDTLICYQEEELTSIAPKLSELGRLVDISRVCVSLMISLSETQASLVQPWGSLPYDFFLPFHRLTSLERSR